MSTKLRCWRLALWGAGAEKGIAGTVAESFFATLKTELCNHQRFATRAEARQAIFEYIEVFYNRKGLHSSVEGNLAW